MRSEKKKTLGGYAGKPDIKANKQVSAPNLPFISTLLKVCSLKSSTSGSRTRKLLERVLNFSNAHAPQHPPSLHSLPLFFPLGSESSLAALCSVKASLTAPAEHHD